MDYTGRLQAVGLASLLLFSLLGAAGPFAGVAAADQGTVSFDASTYADGDTATVTVEDADLSTSEEYVVNVQSDTETQETIFSEDVEDGVTSITTEHPVAETNGDNKITAYEIVYDNGGDSSGVISSISRNENGTVSIRLKRKSDSNDVIGYTRGETAKLTHQANNQFSGKIKITKSDTDGELSVSDGDIINATYSDESAGKDRIADATIDEGSTDTDSDPLSLGPTTEFAADSLNGTTLSHTASVIEVPFSEDVTKAGGASGALTLGGNVTVAVDGENVTDRYVLDADGSADGQVVVSSATPVDPRESVTVTVNAVNDSADTETLEPGGVEVTTTDATAAESVDTNAYEAEPVAFVAEEPDRAFDVSNGSGTVVFSGRTGTGSQVFVFDTDARNWSGEYTIESMRDDGSVAATTDVALRDLRLSVGADDRNVTTADGIDARVSAADSGREVEVSLQDAEGSVVERRNRTLGGDGDAAVEFQADLLAAAGSGNYTVNTTDPATDATTESDRIRVVDADAQTADFGSTIVAEHAGDVVALDVAAEYTEAVTVTVGGPDAGFSANATVEDSDGDGRARLRFNTAAAANATAVPNDGGEVFGAVPPDGNASSSSDAVVAAGIDAGAATGALDAGEYDLAVRPGANATDPASGVGTLVLRQPSPERLDTQVAPAGADLSTRAAIAAASADGRLTDTTEVAAGDTVVHRIVAPGIAGELARGSENTTEAFFGLSGTADGDLYGLNVTQRDPGANTDPYRLRLNQTTARVVADARNDTYFVIYRSDGPPAVPWNGTAETGPPDPDAPAAGESLSVAFTVHETGPFADLGRPNRTVTADHTIVTPQVDAADPVVVTNVTNQSITGTTTLAPGTEIDLRIRSANGTDSQFLKTTRVVVDSNRTWNATVDFDDRRVGDNFTVRSAVGIVASADELAVDGEVRATLVRNTATPTARSTTTSGGVGGGGGGGSGDDRDPDPATASPEPTATPTPAQQTDSGGSVLDSAGQFLGEVVGTTVSDADAESIRERLLGLDVAVSVAALLGVVLVAFRLW